MRRMLIVTLTALFALAFAGVADSRDAVERVIRTPIGSSENERASEVTQTSTVRTAAPLFLIVKGTPDGKVVPVPTASYRGRVAKGTTLTMNGEPVATSRLGFWAVKVPLETGENTFTFIATRGADEMVTVVREVTFDPSLSLSHSRMSERSGTSSEVAARQEHRAAR